MSKDNGYIPAIILTIIVLVTTGLLALTSGLTQAARDAQAVAAANANRLAVYPTAGKFEPIDLTPYAAEIPGVTEAYIVHDGNGALIGYLYQSEFRGYASEVPVLVAISPNSRIVKALVLENDETPGLGKKVADESFIGQFVGLDTTKVYTVKPNETDKTLLDAIAGATISSTAVTRAINQANALHQLVVTEVK
jgi:electron transport complex protein RnfG